MRKRDRQKCLVALNHYFQLLKSEDTIKEAWQCLSVRDRKKISLEEFYSEAKNEGLFLPTPISWQLEFVSIAQIAIFRQDHFFEVVDIVEVRAIFTFSGTEEVFDRIFLLIKENNDWKIYEKSDLFETGVCREVRVGNVIIAHKL